MRTKRACKAGIEYAIAKDHRVHFLLDDVDMECVVGKNHAQDVDSRFGSWRSITGSELRWVFRHWDDDSTQKHVLFWRAGQRVQAPWEAQPQLWEGYRPRRHNRTEPSRAYPGPAQGYLADWRYLCIAAIMKTAGWVRNALTTSEY